MSSKKNETVTKDPSRPALVPKLRFPEFEGEWEERRLGECGELLSSLKGKAGADFDVGSARFITYMNVFVNTFADASAFRQVNVGDDEKQNKVARGDVFFTISSETPEEVGMSSVLLADIENCYLNSFCALFRFHTIGWPNSLFTGYLLRQPTVRNYFAKKAQGSTRFNLSKDAFRLLPLFIPTLPEQQRIADCLSSLDELIDAQARKVDALKTHKKGLMQQLFPREGETQPRLRFPEFEGEWRGEPLGSLCDRIMDGTHFSPKSTTGPRPYLTSKNVKNGRMDLSDLSFISEEEHAEIYRKCPVVLYDVLLTKDGANTGNCAINDIDYEFSLLSSVAVLRGNPRRLCQEFLLYSIMSEIIQSQITEAMSGQAISRITLAKIGLFVMHVPSLPEQQRIADCLSSLDELITNESNKLETYKTHKKGLMQQLFPIFLEN